MVFNHYRRSISHIRWLVVTVLLSWPLAGCVVTSGPEAGEIGLDGIGVADDGLSVDVGPAWGGGAFVDENNYYGGGHHHGGHGRR